MNPQVNTALKKAGTLANDLLSQLEVVGRYTYDKLTDVNQQIEDANFKLQSLDQEYKEKQIRADQDFKLQLLADRKKACQDFAEENGLIFVDQGEWDDKVDAANDVKKQVETAVAKATNALKSQLETKYQLETSESQIEVASLKNQLEQADSKIGFLEAQIQRMTNELNLAGQRIVEVAQAQSATVNIEGKK